jgi:hypothetical protein
MYCHKCGYKIDPGKNRCPHCGEDAGRAEVCGGFYGIAGKAALSEESRQKTSPRRQDPEDIKKKYEALLDTEKKKAERKQQQSRLFMGGAALLAVLFLIFGIFQSLALGRVKKDLKEYESRESTAVETFRQVLALQDRIQEKQKDLLKAEQERDGLSQALEMLEQQEEEPEEETEEPQSAWQQFLKLLPWLKDQEDQNNEFITSMPDQAAVEKMEKQLSDCEGRIRVIQSEIEDLEQQRIAILEEMGLSREEGKE